MRLLFQDAEDLTVVSAHAQDALLRIGDVRRLPHERRFVAMLTRFCWEEVKRPLGVLPPVGPFHRVRAGLHFDGVTAVRLKGLDLARSDDVLELLAVTFTPGSPPGGMIMLSFSGGATLELTVECVEGAMADQGEPWESAHLPRHRA